MCAIVPQWVVLVFFKVAASSASVEMGTGTLEAWLNSETVDLEELMDLSLGS